VSPIIVDNAPDPGAALPRNTRADRGGGVTLKGEWIAVPKADFDALRAALATAKEATDA
jgi:hypothetical protein